MTDIATLIPFRVRLEQLPGRAPVLVLWDVALGQVGYQRLTVSECVTIAGWS